MDWAYQRREWGGQEMILKIDPTPFLLEKQCYKTIDYWGLKNFVQ